MFLIDIQGFHQQANRFVVKELAVQALRTNESACVLFQPPFEWTNLPASCKATNSLLMRNFHGLTWDIGFISYFDILTTIEKLTEGGTVLFVKGLQKKKWLQLYTDKLVINLEDLGCPKIQDGYPDDNDEECWIHQEHSLIQPYACAYRNCQRFRTWFKKYFPRALEAPVDFFPSAEEVREMSSQDLIAFLGDFLLEFGVNNIDGLWEKLPDELKMYEDLKDYRRCEQQFRLLGALDDFDGPLPFRKNCSSCQLQNFNDLDD